jgi:hypothetical protein
MVFYCPEYHADIPKHFAIGCSTNLEFLLLGEEGYISVMTDLEALHNFNDGSGSFSSKTAYFYMAHSNSKKNIAAGSDAILRAPRNYVGIGIYTRHYSLSSLHLLMILLIVRDEGEPRGAVCREEGRHFWRAGRFHA